MKRKIKIFYAWLNFHVGYWTTNGRKSERILGYYTDYMNAKYLNV